jgi:glucose-1-phosphate cytidylyltransferase
MNVVILAGGLGSRLSEETTVRPKPMVEIGEVPILVHIMRIYARHGFKNFTIALGYKGDVIKEYFLNHYIRVKDLTVHCGSGRVEYGTAPTEDWIVRMVDTGQATMTGGRLRRLEPIVKPAGRFMMTYGDGVADVDLTALLAFHGSHGRIATVTAVRPPARFGAISLAGDRVKSFQEKPQLGEGWINGGFFVFEAAVFKYLGSDETVLEAEPLERLAADGQLMCYRHTGFWQAMDTVRDRDLLNGLWKRGSAPWDRTGAV